MRDLGCLILLTVFNIRYNDSLVLKPVRANGRMHSRLFESVEEEIVPLIVLPKVPSIAVSCIVSSNNPKLF